MHDDESDDDETPIHSQLMKLVKEVRKEVSVSKNILPNRLYHRLAEVFKCNICFRVPMCRGVQTIRLTMSSLSDRQL